MRSLISIALALVIGGAGATAWACGGFFCNQVPIDQSGEQIVFTVEEGHVAATIQINYTGPSEKFAWVLPLQAVPEVKASTAMIFQRLRQATEPVFYLDYDSSNQCGSLLLPVAEAGAVDADRSPGGGVQVLKHDVVGPYDMSVVQSDDPEALFKWLDDNGYDQPPEAKPLIEHYVEQQYVFLALRLHKGNDAGDIVPVRVEMPTSEPCVPLVLTAIAATPDMPVRIWVLGKARAIPTNWFHVVLNLKLIDWFNGGSNYTDLVTKAVDEAAGHGFVTEFAGSTALLDQLFYAEGQYDLHQLALISDPVQFVLTLQQQFLGTPELLNLLREFLPMPDAAAAQGVTEQQFYNNPQEYAQFYATIDFDPQALVAALDERIVTPLKTMQADADRMPYLTRLFTTVSPDEMDRDPIFAFNSSLPDVSNVHQATVTFECKDGQPTHALITLEDGTTFAPTLPPWWGGDLPPGDDLSGEPAAASIELIPADEGAPIGLAASSAEHIDNLLRGMPAAEVVRGIENGDIPVETTEPATQPTQPTPTQPLPQADSGGSGCHSGGAPLAPFAAVLALLALVAWRRRMA